MAIGLPSIDITFKRLAETLVQRSARGIVSLIIKDDTDTTYEVKEYKSQFQIDPAKFTTNNVQYIKDVFSGGAAKVIVAPVATSSVAVVGDALERIGSRKYNWIGLAEGSDDEQTDLVAFVKEQEKAGKSIKAIVFNATNPDCQHVVNFTNPSLTLTNGKITGEKFIARLLGLLAGLPLTRSSTYYAFNDVVSVEEPADVEAAVDSGKFVLFNDEDIVRVARGVNSLTTLSNTITEDFKKILIVESMDLIREDISGTFKNEFLGKFKNKYDNQVLFITAINNYFTALAGEDILDDTYANKSFVDVEEQRAAWVASGKSEAEDWDDQTVINNSFRSKVFLAGNIKINDAMEDLKFGIELQ